MLNKEEIEEGKAHLYWLLDNGILASEDEQHIEIILEYIKQLEQEKADRIDANNYENSYIAKLETREQKLIEKLEERRKQNNNRYGQAIDNDDFEEMYEYSGQVHEDDYILKILKGEKK